MTPIRPEVTLIRPGVTLLKQGVAMADRKSLWLPESVPPLGFPPYEPEPRFTFNMILHVFCVIVCIEPALIGTRFCGVFVINSDGLWWPDKRRFSWQQGNLKKCCLFSFMSSPEFFHELDHPKAMSKVIREQSWLRTSHQMSQSNQQTSQDYAEG